MTRPITTRRPRRLYCWTPRISVELADLLQNWTVLTSIHDDLDHRPNHRDIHASAVFCWLSFICISSTQFSQPISTTSDVEHTFLGRTSRLIAPREVHFHCFFVRTELNCIVPNVETKTNDKLTAVRVSLFARSRIFCHCTVLFCADFSATECVATETAFQWARIFSYTLFGHASVSLEAHFHGVIFVAMAIAAQTKWRFTRSSLQRRAKHFFTHLFRQHFFVQGSADFLTLYRTVWSATAQSNQSEF